MELFFASLIFSGVAVLAQLGEFLSKRSAAHGSDSWARTARFA